ncbi:ROK family protein [Frondihabitans cladoniiphilus]|uniref:ROK family protein n=1 Tax=Frondihabitans cladoniiphilus TaxID=715785 RepID=A0ABP8W1B4_9MICO
MVSEINSHASRVLDLFRSRREISRLDVMQLSGLSRSTVNHRLSALTRGGLLVPLEGGSSNGGRPSSRFAFNADRARLLTADIGASGFTAALCDLNGVVVRHTTRRIDVWEGPLPVLTEVASAFAEVTDGEATEIWGIGVGVPGPVDFASGQVVSPPIMTGWDRFDIKSWFADRYRVPVVVENDVNARAVAESRALDCDDLISLKVGTGIGSGLVFNGRIIRGHEGAAGDIGHTRAAIREGEPEAACRCGNTGCVEAYAGGWAILRDLRAAGVEVADVAGIVALVARGDITAVGLVRQAGRVLGDAVADLVGILNPRIVVISGQLAACGELLLTGVQERVHQRALPLATRALEISTSRFGQFTGVTGLALITADRVLDEPSLDSLLESA